jgi:hypothetical protein
MKKVVRKLLAGFTCDGKGAPKRDYSVVLQSVPAAAELNCALMQSQQASCLCSLYQDSRHASHFHIQPCAIYQCHGAESFLSS